MTNKKWGFPIHFDNHKELSALRIEADKESRRAFKDRRQFLQDMFNVTKIGDVPEIQLPRLLQLCRNVKIEDTK